MGVGWAAFILLWPWLLLELARAEFCKWYGHLPQLSECGQGALLLGLEVTGAHPASSLLGRPFSPWPLGVESTGPDAPAPGGRELVSSAADRFSLVGLVDFKIMEYELARQPEKGRQRARGGEPSGEASRQREQLHGGGEEQHQLLSWAMQAADEAHLLLREP